MKFKVDRSFALLLLPFLVTLSMLTDRACCHNVREKKIIAHKVISIVNVFGIVTFLCEEGI